MTVDTQTQRSGATDGAVVRDIRGRTALVTGGARGIGLGIARALHARGANIALADVDEQALEDARAAFAPSGGVVTFVLDVRDRARFDEVIVRAEAEVGPVSLLFNNAGLAAGVRIEQMTYDMWEWVLGVNLGGVVNGVQAMLPRLLARRDGHIVNTASGAGLAVVGAGAGVLYHASKYAVVGLSEALRRDLEPFGVGVSVLCPGPVATGIYENALATATRPGGPRPIGPETERLSRWLQNGTSPDAVGEIVVDAVMRNQLFIHSDRFMEDAIRTRTEALLAAMPSLADEVVT